MSGHRSLAFQLHAQLRDAPPGLGPGDQNALLSPCGIWSSMAMLTPGAGGATRDQLTELLGIETLQPVQELSATLARRQELTDQQRMLVERNLTRTIDPEILRVHLMQGQAIWIQESYQLAPTYIATLQDSLGTAPRPLDFANAPDDACAAVNRWVAETTDGRIATMLDPDILSPVTRAIVTSAVVFRSRWADIFPERATRDAPFTCLDGSRIAVPTMHRIGQMAYTADDDIAVVELPYNNRDLVLDLLVPRPGRFEAVERVMSMAYLFVLLGELDHQAVVELHLPRFAIESDLQLGQTLAALGASDVFSTGADFTALSHEPGFHLDDVLHRAVFSVDEQGTDTAAAPMPKTNASGPSEPREPIPLRIDRPFFFVVRDVPTNSILFFGRCGDPTASTH